MWSKLSKRKKRFYIALLCIAILLGLCTSYLLSYLPANDIARQSLGTSETVEVIDNQDSIAFRPLIKNVTTALIYYPGGKVEPSSFAYAAHTIAEEGILVIIQKMPFNLAIFNPNAATNTIKNNPQIKNWFLSGFSLGGTAASMYAHKNQSALAGLLLYASYTTKDFTLANADFPVISISGSKDALATPADISKAKHYLPKETTFIQIQGGNHTQMALYNNSKPQQGDHAAEISNMEQQTILIQETLQFIQNNTK